MSSLRHRLRRVQQPTAQGGTEAEEASSRVLPLSSCIQFLNGHPFVQLFRLDANVLHSAIVHLDNYLTESATTSSSAGTSQVQEVSDGETKAAPTGGCFECHGYLLVDEHNGCEVCSKCGLVQTRRGINITPEYNAGVDVNTLQPLHKRAKGIQGVPKWMVQSMQEHETSYMEELHHMNAFTNIALDDLAECNRILKRWSGGHFSSDVRVAACLLHHLLRDRFIDESDVRRRVRTITQQSGTEIVNGRPTWFMSMERMPVIDRIGPAPQFACPTCGHMEHTRKGATFHCKRGIAPTTFVAVRRREPTLMGGRR